ncbi:hypothetical protein ACMXYV_10240 [Neptuniibacter sp. SY11_33]|uniref:hypothetical protein n=1 Tax=Neptuniibacter sp. SY11_33 TaxID=3398215 RepID=UPI0039F5A6D7
MKRVLKLISLITIFAWTSSVTAMDLIFQHSTGVTIEDDPFICNPIERNKFKEFQANLARRYNTNLEDSYFDIECNDNDILGIVIESAASRYNFTFHLELYLKKINQPELLSRMIINEVDTRDLLTRIDIDLQYLPASLRGTVEEKKLLKLKQKFTKWLEKYPVATN